MAINWHVFRDATEANTPPTVDGVTALEGGILARHDDVTDNVNHCFYIMVRKNSSGAGTYVERWRVLNNAKNATDAGPFSISETVTGNTTELLLLSPQTSTSRTAYRSLNLGNVSNPTDSQVIAAVSGWSSAIQNNFGRTITRAVFNSDVNGVYIQAEF